MGVKPAASTIYSTTVARLSILLAASDCKIMCALSMVADREGLS